MATQSNHSLMVLFVSVLLPTTAMIVVGMTFGTSAVRRNSSEDVDEGRLKVASYWFTKRCSGCHGAKGRRGPSLAMIGKTAATRKPGLSAEQYLLESILKPDAFAPPGFHKDMPQQIAAGIDEEGLRALVYYLMSQGGTPQVEKIDALVITPLEAQSSRKEDTDKDSVMRGLEIYRSKAGCVKCHPLNHLPGLELAAPSIFGAGLYDTKRLHEAVFEPSKSITPGYEQVLVSLPDGTSTRGRVLDRNDKSLTLIAEKEGNWSLQTIDLAADEDGEVPQVVATPLSSMPGNYRELLTEQEQEDLMAFLRTLVSRQ